MELRRLRYFAVLAKHLHFGRAAAELGIAQPGLSQQIKLLERELRATLVHRDRRGVSLTPAGEVLCAEATAILQQCQLLEQRVRTAARGMSGLLRIAYTRSAADMSVSQLVREFQDEYPQVDVSTVTGWTSWNLDLLRGRKADVAFVRGPVEHSGIDRMTLYEQELVAALPADHELATLPAVDVADLRRERVVLWPRHQGSSFFDHLIGQVWPDGGPNIVHEEPESEQILAAVAAGVGVSVLDRPRASKLCPPEVVLRPFAGEHAPSVEVGIAWRHRDPAPAIRQFVDWCRRRYAPG